LGLQRRLALHARLGAILEGRDIGTVVFPDADVKVFLVADETVRARRRFEELFAKGVEKPLSEVLSEQSKRDRDDASRDVAPLRPAADAVRLDSTALALSDVVHQIEQLVHRARDGRLSSP
jgi:CMP/dCMP kinase